MKLSRDLIVPSLCFWGGAWGPSESLTAVDKVFGLLRVKSTEKEDLVTADRRRDGRLLTFRISPIIYSA